MINYPMLSPPWQACVKEAWAAYCAGSLPIGAAITGEDGRVVARGRNRIYEDQADRKRPRASLAGVRIAHAEINALLALGALLGHAPGTAYTLYTTLEPCPMCLGAARICRLSALHFAARDPVAGSSSLADSSPFMRIHSVRCHSLGDAGLERILLAMQVERFIAWDMALWPEAAAERGATYAAAVELGRQLHASGQLADLAARAAHVSEVLASLA